MSQQNNNKKLERKVRRSYFVSTLSVALVLFLLGSVGYLIINAISATDRIKESVSVFVMLKNDLGDEKHEQLKKKLEAHEHVGTVKFVSKTEAAEDFKEYVGSDFVEFLEFNPLPNSFEVSLQAKSAEKEIVTAFEKELLTWEGVDELVYQRSVIEQISSNINKFNIILLLFGGTLLIISLILLNNTIRMSILSKRYIINTMKMVGATRWFIMRPFIGRAFLQGIYAGVIACVMFYAMQTGLSEGLPEIKFSAEAMQMYMIMGAMVAMGVFISLVFTTFAVRKFIRMQTNNLHLY
ncbi:MAG: permease-like cell division protein FtsX [Rikenellaceae bacterium]